MSEQCTYTQAAYPTLSAEDTCVDFHRHEPRVFALARALADMFQDDHSDEKVAWFLNDADAVVDDFDPTPEAWIVAEQPDRNEHGIDCWLSINGETYVIQASEWEPAVPVRLSTFRSWQEDEDA